MADHCTRTAVRDRLSALVAVVTAEPEGVEAGLADGVLTVRVPKPAQSRPPRIEVKNGNGSR